MKFGKLKLCAEGAVTSVSQLSVLSLTVRSAQHVSFFSMALSSKHQIVDGSVCVCHILKFHSSPNSVMSYSLMKQNRVQLNYCVSPSH